MDPIVELLQENANKQSKATVHFPNVHSNLCDPDYGQTPKFALFSYIPNHIQFEKNKKLFEALYEKTKLDEQTKDLLVKMFCSQGPTFPGIGKIRGCFKTLKEATRRAEYLVKEVDPFTSVMICYVGTPFPLVEGGFAADSYLAENSVDDAIKKDAMKKRTKREKDIRELKNREQKVLQSQNTEMPILDKYIQQRVKFAQIKTTLADMTHKTQEYAKTLTGVIEEIKHMEKTDPGLVETYLASYSEACKEVGVTPSDGFLKLMSQSFED